MNIEICKQCKELKFLPLRYKCNLSIKYIYKYNAYKKSQQQIIEPFVTENTFFNYNCPNKCNNHGKRKKENCEKCNNFVIEEPRIKCRKCFNANIHKSFLNNIKLNENCIYNFEQEYYSWNKKK